MTPASLAIDLSEGGGQALREVLDTLLSAELQPLAGANMTPHEVPAISSKVPLHGPSGSGEVTLFLPALFAEWMAERLLGEQGEARRSAAEVDDLAGELGNMVAGRIAALAHSHGLDCQLGTPCVVRGKESHGASDLSGVASRTHWLCEGHPLTLEVSWRNHSR